MEPSGRRVIFVQWRSVGHVNASLVLARRLKIEGHHVTFIGPSELALRITGAGFQFQPAEIFNEIAIPIGVGRKPGDLARLISNPGQLIKFVRMSRDNVKALLAKSLNHGESFISIVSEYRPDLIIYDPFLLYYHILLRGVQEKAVSLSSKHLATQDRYVPPYTSSFVPTEGLVSIVLVRLIWWRTRLFYWLWVLWERTVFGISPYAFAAHLAKRWPFPLRMEWRCRSIPTDICFKSVPEWVLQAQELDFPRSCVARKTVYLGPIIDRSDVSALQTPRSRERQLVLVVLTTVFRPMSAASARRCHFIESLVAAAKTLDRIDFVISTGPGFTSAAFGDAPPNVSIHEWVSIPELLTGCDLVICQGGNNMVREAIAEGRRLLLFPDAADQRGAAARLAYHGIACFGKFGRMDPGILCKLILNALTNEDQARRIEIAKNISCNYSLSTRLREAVNQAL